MFQDGKDKRTEYEKKRDEICEQNAKKLDALGLKRLVDVVFRSSKGANSRGTEKEKRKGNCNDKDSDYVPGEGEDKCTEDDDPTTVQMNKPKKKATQRKKDRNQNHLEMDLESTQQDGLIPHQGTLALPPQQSTQAPSPSSQANQEMSSSHVGTSSAASTAVSRKKRVRGPTRGKKVDKIRKVLSQPLPVEIDRATMEIIGANSTRVANALGEHIRDHAPVLNKGWREIDFGIKESIVLRVAQSFDIGDYNNGLAIREIIDKKCQQLYAEWKSRLHKHYEKLRENKTPDIKSKTLHPCKLDDWVYMIDNVWETEDWKTKSGKAKYARTRVKYNHTSGSKSFRSRADEYMKMNNGEKQSVPDGFKETHTRHKHGGVWISDEARQNHEQMVSKISEQSQPDVSAPLSEIQILKEVLGKRSIYVKRSIRKVSSAQIMERDAEVIGLKQKIAEQAQKLAEQGQKQSLFENILVAIASKSGVDISSILASNDDDTLASNDDGTSNWSQGNDGTSNEPQHDPSI